MTVSVTIFTARVNPVDEAQITRARYKGANSKTVNLSHRMFDSHALSNIKQTFAAPINRGEPKFSKNPNDAAS